MSQQRTGIAMTHSTIRTALLGISFLAVFAAPALAVTPLFSLGEISLAQGTPSAYRQLVADTLNAELETSRPAKAQEGFVVHARLVQLHTEGTRPAKSNCTVSLVVARRESGSIYAMTQGKVTVEDGAAERAEMTACRTATKSAFTRASAALSH
jgi:hypothetical protein